MDPVTIITTAASIVGTAITLSKTLYDTVEAVKDAPSDVRALSSTIDSVKSAVSRLVGFMNNEDECMWPDQWLEDVMNDVEAIGLELKEVQKLIKDWGDDEKQKMGKKSKMKGPWRSWKWHFKVEEVQRCTRRLREAKEDLGLQINVIQMSTTAQMGQNVNEVKDIVGTIRAELAEQTIGHDIRAFNADLTGFAKQISDLSEAILVLDKQARSPSSDHAHRGRSSPNVTINTSQRVADNTAFKFSEFRKSFESVSSESSSSILSPLAALNHQAFLQNQHISRARLEMHESPIDVAVLGLKMADLQRKYDRLLINWDNALRHSAYLQNELDRRVGRSFTGKVEDSELSNFVSPLEEKDEEIESREAVIDVLKGQNEALQDMISERVTIVGYTDDALNARDLGKQLLAANKRVNRQQEKIDLLKWRLDGEQSSLREQLKVNKILDDEVKLMKQKAEDKGHGNKGRRRGFFPPNSRRYGDDRQNILSGSQVYHPYSPSHPPRTPSSSSISNKSSLWPKSPDPRIFAKPQVGEAVGWKPQSLHQSVSRTFHNASDHYV